ncbi:hypothetical protein [Streptomyces sp. NPDC056323]|uniref:hypothetical protein n=1 Tax=unclassified Streptomyces TaxID=2593676 RepID=UPI0035E2C8DB
MVSQPLRLSMVPVSWRERRSHAEAHFAEEEIGAINLEIALTNFFNRINRTIKEPAGQTWG